VHIDITELEKAIGANIGSKLRIGDDFYENLQEIVERYIIPCNRSLREILQHPKFIKTSNVEELKKSIETEKEEDASRIPYKFTVLDKYPQYVVLAYMPKKELVKEFIKVKPRGYFFHQQYHYPFQNMINWFKQEFRTKEYQRFVRKTGSPQLIAGAQNNPSNQPMEGDVKNEPAKDNWGNTVKNEKEAWGVDNVTM
jgi:transcription elongation factor SPT6